MSGEKKLKPLATNGQNSRITKSIELHEPKDREKDTAAARAGWSSFLIQSLWNSDHVTLFAHR
jgi:hypothetical protein